MITASAATTAATSSTEVSSNSSQYSFTKAAANWRISNTLAPAAPGNAPFALQAFAATFLNDYWLYFELTSVLLVIAVVAALAVIKERGEKRG